MLKKSQQRRNRSRHLKGKARYAESDSDSSQFESDTNSNVDSDEETKDDDVKQMMDLVVKSFKKMGRSSNRGKFSRKIPNSDRDR